MKKLLELLGNKYFLWILIALSVFGMLKVSSCSNERLEKQQEHQRQVSGQLSDTERELQQADHKLGLLGAQLLSQADLNKKLKKYSSKLNKNFKDFVKRHNLTVKSLDTTIFALNQKLKGESSTEVSESCTLGDNCVIKYRWQDKFKRFQLRDPNIFKPDDEEFDVSQLFQITGAIFGQKDGSLQVRRLELQEAYFDADGKLNLVPGSKAKIVSSNFEYSNDPEDTETDWKDIFKLRMIGATTLSIFPNGGKSMLGIGTQLLEYEGLGLGTFTAIDFDNLGKSEQKLYLNIIPKVFDLDLNLAIGPSIGTSFDSLFKSYSVGVDIIFFITN